MVVVVCRSIHKKTLILALRLTLGAKITSQIPWTLCTRLRRQNNLWGIHLCDFKFDDEYIYTLMEL